VCNIFVLSSPLFNDHKAPLLLDGTVFLVDATGHPPFPCPLLYPVVFLRTLKLLLSGLVPHRGSAIPPVHVFLNRRIDWGKLLPPTPSAPLSGVNFSHFQYPLCNTPWATVPITFPPPLLPFTFKANHTPRFTVLNCAAPTPESPTYRGELEFLPFLASLEPPSFFPPPTPFRSLSFW